jgi:hypothetical protein
MLPQVLYKAGSFVIGHIFKDSNRRSFMQQLIHPATHLEERGVAEKKEKSSPV